MCVCFFSHTNIGTILHALYNVVKNNSEQHIYTNTNDSTGLGKKYTY